MQTIEEMIESTRILIIEANKEIAELKKELKTDPENEFIKAAIEMVREINRDQKSLYKELLAQAK